MNTIEEAAKRLEQGWCRANLTKREKDGDKFCALGAIGAVELGLAVDWYAGLSRPEINERENQIYEALDKSKAVKALAEEIVSQKDIDPEDVDFYNEELRYNPTGIVWQFNDNQDTVEPVLEMFRYAAKRLDAVNDSGQEG